jgi:hypothetical protein
MVISSPFGTTCDGESSIPTLPTKAKELIILKINQYHKRNRIYGSHSSGYKKFYFLAYNTTQSAACLWGYNAV